MIFYISLDCLECKEIFLFIEMLEIYIDREYSIKFVK